MSAPSAYLWGWVDTNLRGYRRLSIGASAVHVPSAVYRWPEFIVALDAALPGSWTATIGTDARITIAGAPAATLTWTDRIGWLLGFGAEPGEVEASATSFVGVTDPPGGLPLLGAVWSGIEVMRDDDLLVDRQARGLGYVWGDARIWRWTLALSLAAYESLRAGARTEGWCGRGKVTISSAGPSTYLAGGAWSPSNLDGYIDGYVLGVSEPDWIDPETRQSCQVSIDIARGA